MPPPFFALYCSLASKVCQIRQRSQDRHHYATIDEKTEVFDLSNHQNSHALSVNNPHNNDQYQLWIFEIQPSRVMG